MANVPKAHKRTHIYKHTPNCLHHIRLELLRERALIVSRGYAFAGGVDSVKVPYVGWSEKWQEWLNVPKNPLESTFRLGK